MSYEVAPSLLPQKILNKLAPERGSAPRSPDSKSGILLLDDSGLVGRLGFAPRPFRLIHRRVSDIEIRGNKKVSPGGNADALNCYASAP